jgi:broad specificity phosphatase PhoE
MLRVLIVRHGQTAHNKEFRNQGRADIELDEIGISQASCLAGALPEVDAVYSSPLKRATKTAQAMAVAYIEDDRLAERDYGTWEGKTREEILASDADAFHRYRNDPVTQASGGGETGIDVFMRSVSFLHELFQRHTEGTVIIVTHGGSGSALIAALINGGPATADAIRLSNCSITEILIEGSRRRVVRLDDHSHLTEAPLRYPHAGFTAK